MHLDILVAYPAACLHLIEDIIKIANLILCGSNVCDDRPEFHLITLLAPETVIRHKFSSFKVRSLELD